MQFKAGQRVTITHEAQKLTSLSNLGTGVIVEPVAGTISQPNFYLVAFADECLEVAEHNLQADGLTVEAIQANLLDTWNNGNRSKPEFLQFAAGYLAASQDAGLIDRDQLDILYSNIKYLT